MAIFRKNHGMSTDLKEKKGKNSVPDTHPNGRHHSFFQILHNEKLHRKSCITHMRLIWQEYISKNFFMKIALSVVIECYYYISTIWLKYCKEKYNLNGLVVSEGVNIL